MKSFILALIFVPQISLLAAIVGADNRLSYQELAAFDPRALADATATQLNSKYLKKIDQDHSSYPSGQIQNQCPGEKFSEMRILGGCSGFLVAPDVLVAAGHCNDYRADGCSSDVWLFKHYSSPNSSMATLKNENLYSCTKVLAYRHDQEADYVVLKLDRPVKNANILKVDTRNQSEIHDPVAILGYPLGLPFTYTPGGRIQTKNQAYIQADLDAFKNNSGSAVVNLRTGFVEGILTNSMKGHSMDSLDGCVQSVHHPQNSYKTLINRVTRIPYIQEMFKQERKLSQFRISSKCTENATVIAKYRDANNQAWTTQIREDFKAGETLEIETKYQDLYLHVKTSSGKTLIRGKDFYGFVDQSRFDEYGLKRFTSEQNQIELCSP